MNKTLSLVLIVLMMLALCACGGSPAPQETPAPPVADIPQESPEQPEAPGDALSMGQSLLKDFEALTAAGETELQTLADALLQNGKIEFAGATMPVEPGYLAGFPEDIGGFEEGLMFGPVIGSIPFVGYVFTTADEAAAESLQETLLAKANPAWNICVVADETVAAHAGNLVFFVMCPNV